MKKKTLVTLLTLGVLISTGYFGANAILAEDSNSKNPHSTLITKIAQKFNLNEDEVAAVFDAVRDEKMAEMKQKHEESLSRAVSDGVITEEQKEALLSKMGDFKTKVKLNRRQMQTWFEEQGIDETKLRPYLGFGRVHKGEMTLR